MLSVKCSSSFFIPSQLNLSSAAIQQQCSCNMVVLFHPSENVLLRIWDGFLPALDTAVAAHAFCENGFSNFWDLLTNTQW